MRAEWNQAYESWSKVKHRAEPDMNPPVGVSLAGWVEQEREGIADEAVDNVIAAFTQVQLFGITYDEFVTRLGDELRRRS